MIQQTTQRDFLGRFTTGHTETNDEKKKRINSLVEVWRNKHDHLKDPKHLRIYNLWRAFMFTKKGKKIGNVIKNILKSRSIK